MDINKITKDYAIYGMIEYMHAEDKLPQPVIDTLLRCPLTKVQQAYRRFAKNPSNAPRILASLASTSLMGCLIERHLIINGKEFNL